MKYDVKQYYLYDEMIELLECWAGEYSEILTVSSIGKSYQGREIPLAALTINNGKKPAVLLTGNLHSAELIGSCAVLHTIHELLARSEEPEIRAILEEKMVYCVPRLNVDSAEANLTGDDFYRGSMLPFHEEEDGIVPCDVDGDGAVRKMRRKNPEGLWYSSELDDSIMFQIIPGKPIPEDAERYDLVCEGTYKGEGKTMFVEARNPCDIDPNRSFPFDWDKNMIGITLRPSAGDHPLQDCETRALAQFVTAHPEIVMAIDTHSNMGAYITPMEFCRHMDYDGADEAIFDALGAELSALSGYQATNIFPREVVGPARGSYTTWLYFTLGIPAWCAEIGSLKQLYTDKESEASMMYMQQLLEERDIVIHEQNMVKWDQQKNGGKYYAPWHEFDHPQFGRVEIGGWTELFPRWNLPGEYVDQECKMAFQFNLRNIESAGHLKLREFRVSGKGADKTVGVTIENIGRFPSTKTYQGARNGASSAGVVRIFGYKDEEEKVLMSEQLPIIKGGQKITLDWKLPRDDDDYYKITLEGECAGVQTMLNVPHVSGGKEEK